MPKVGGQVQTSEKGFAILHCQSEKEAVKVRKPCCLVVGHMGCRLGCFRIIFLLVPKKEGR